MFAYLASRPGEAVSREELYAQVWGYADAVVSRTVDTTVRRLRTKIEADPSNPAHLQTVHGQGYRFRPPVAPDGLGGALGQVRGDRAGARSEPAGRGGRWPGGRQDPAPA